MNIQETLSLIEALKSAGVVKFKSLEHDIEFNDSVKISVQRAAPIRDSFKEHSIPDEPVIENAEATEKLKDLIGTLKLSDEDLANRMFPDGAM